MGNQTNNTNKTQPINNKNNNNDDVARRMLDALSKKNTSDIKNVQMPKFFTGEVISVSDDNNWADVKLIYGEDEPLLLHINNKSNVVLNIGDEVFLTAPKGDLSSIYIDKSKTDSPTFDGAKIVGTLIVGGINNENGTIVIKGIYDNDEGLRLHDHTIDIMDWIKDHYRVGSISAVRSVDGNGNIQDPASLAITTEQNCSAIMSVADGDAYTTVFEVSNNAYNDGVASYMHSPFYIRNKVNIDVNSSHAFYCQSDADGGNQLYGHINHEGWDINSVSNMNCVNLNVSGTKSAVQETQHYDKVNFYAVESPDNRFVDYMYGKTTSCECVIYIEPEIQECINTDIEYWIEFHPNKSCKWEIIEKNSDYFVITTDKDVEFMCILSGMRRGFEHIRLFHPDNIFNELNIKDEIDISKELKDINNDTLLINQLLQDESDKLLNN